MVRLRSRRPGDTSGLEGLERIFRRSICRVLPISYKSQRKVFTHVRLSEIHEQEWFPQFLRDEFVDELQMILDVTNTYQPIAKLLRSRLQQCGANRVLDLCSGAGGPWPSLLRDFENSGAQPPRSVTYGQISVHKKAGRW